MKIFDLIFFKTFQFGLKLKKAEGDSKWSAFLLVSTYFACVVIILVSFIGLFHENYVCSIFKKHTIEFWMSIWVLSPIILSLRYYKLTNISNIEENYNFFI